MGDTKGIITYIEHTPTGQTFAIKEITLSLSKRNLFCLKELHVNQMRKLKIVKICSLLG